MAAPVSGDARHRSQVQTHDLTALHAAGQEMFGQKRKRSARNLRIIKKVVLQHHAINLPNRALDHLVSLRLFGVLAIKWLNRDAGAASQVIQAAKQLSLTSQQALYIERISLLLTLAIELPLQLLLSQANQFAELRSAWTRLTGSRRSISKQAMAPASKQRMMPAFGCMHADRRKALMIG